MVNLANNGNHQQLPEDTPVEPVGRWKAMVTQTDWSSRVTQETWYGHHQPCRRLAWFVQLSVLCSTVAWGLVLFDQAAIFQPLESEQVDHLRNVHFLCLQEMCTDTLDIQMTCQVNDNGITARVATFPYKMNNETKVQVERLPIPTKCREAVSLTINPGVVTQYLDDMDLFHTTKQTDGRRAIFQLEEEHCMFREMFLSNILSPNNTNGRLEILHSGKTDFSRSQPGDEITIPLRNYFCALGEHPLIRTTDVDQSFDFPELFDQLFYIRHILAICAIYTFHLSTTVLGATADLVAFWKPACLLGWLLPWPKNKVGGRKITFFSIFSTLLLLVQISSRRTGDYDDVLLVSMLSGGAWAYGNGRAQDEWVYFGLLWVLGVSSANDQFQEWIQSFATNEDRQKLLSYAGTYLNSTIPGQGLWKLMTVYVIVMAFPRQPARNSK